MAVKRGQFKKQRKQFVSKSGEKLSMKQVKIRYAARDLIAKNAS